MTIRNISLVLLALALLGIGTTTAMGGCCCDGSSGLPIPPNCDAIVGDETCCQSVGGFYVPLMSGGPSGCQAADCTELLRTSPLVQIPPESSFVERVPAGASAIVKEEDDQVDMLIALADEDKDRAKVKSFIKRLPLYSTTTEDKTTELIALANQDQDSAAAEQTANSSGRRRGRRHRRARLKTKKEAKAAPKMPRYSLQSHHGSIAETDAKEAVIKNDRERHNKSAEGRMELIVASAKAGMKANNNVAERHSKGQQGQGPNGPGKLEGPGKRSPKSQGKKGHGKKDTKSPR